MPLSLKNKDLGEGLYAGGPTLIKSLIFDTFNYDGQVKKPVTVLKAVMIPLDGDNEGEEFEENMSVGRGKVPVNGGRGIDNEKGGKSTALSAQSKAGRFLRSLFAPLDEPEAGFPEDKVDDDITVMAPIKVVLVRKEMPKMEGGGGGITGQRSDRTPTVLLVSEILAMPWELKDKGKGKAKDEDEEEERPRKKGKSAPEPEDEDEEEAGAVTPGQRKKAVKLVKQVLADADDTLTSAQVGKAVFKALKGDDDQEVISRLVHDEEFLGDEDAPWTYNEDKDTLSL